MPNLQQLLFLREKYGESNNLMKSLNEGLIKKAFNITNITEAFRFFDYDFAENISDYFNKREKLNIVLLYIDIVNFSKLFIQNDTNNLSRFLDKYYDKIIPIIYNYGGEIEKLMGDGIIAVFGKPFLNDEMGILINKAHLCAKLIIEKNYNTLFNVKIALHNGQIMYYKNNSDQYYDYTIIGRTITELYRLESVSYKNSINYYTENLYQSFIQSNFIFRNRLSLKLSKQFIPNWILGNERSADLKGVVNNVISYIKYKPV